MIFILNNFEMVMTNNNYKQNKKLKFKIDINGVC